ncbi:MAG TPA: DUF366 family protein [Bdellovibrionales bacterium]|nr:DUF366 family protein [Bdellovibrionales bacterium]
MKSIFVNNEFPYDGSQLRSLFGYLDHGVQGDSIVAWVGSCNIPRDHMVDGEDLLAGETIAGDQMVHFIIEKFNSSLLAAVALQRLFASICLELVREFVNDPQIAAQFRREGDDLFFGPGKLSISIATVTPISSMIHFAVNVTNEGTPVRTACLGDFDMPPEEFARKAMKRFADEMVSIESATTKVRWVK